MIAKVPVPIVTVPVMNVSSLPAPEELPRNREVREILACWSVSGSWKILSVVWEPNWIPRAFPPGMEAGRTQKGPPARPPTPPLNRSLAGFSSTTHGAAM